MGGDMKIKAVLFDKDGTLIDVNRTWIPLYREMLASEFKVSADGAEALLAKAGYDKASDSFLAGSTLAGGTTKQLVGIWWPDLDVKEQAAKAHHIDHHYAPLARQYLKPLLDLAPVFQALQALGLRLGVATNDTAFSAKGQMQKLAVDHYFESIIGADTVAVAKPSGQMIRHFANSAGLQPSEIAMVGDNIHDLEEAKNGGAGMAIGVLTGNAKRHHIEHAADHVFESVAELPKFFGGSLGGR
jgi:phosphoglycolate phosphatase